MNIEGAIKAARNLDRLAVLRQLGLLDTPTNENFDRLTRLASRITNSPISLVSLVDANRQFFKSQVGLPDPWATLRETPLSHSFCMHVTAENAPLIVEDARNHPVLKDNLAIPDLGVIGYLGIPITMTDGTVLGSFCVIDTTPRNWTSDEIEIMHELTHMVMVQVELMAERKRAEIAMQKHNDLLEKRIRERVRTTQQLQKYQEHLEDLVRERTTALTGQAQVLMQKNADLRRFAYIAAHDLREPLRTVRLYTERLEQRYQNQFDERANKYMSYIVDGATRVYALITDLLSYSQLEQTEASLTLTNLDDILTRVLADLENMIKRSGAVVTCNHLPDLQVDADQVTRLFQNLISNSIKFQNGVEPRVDISAVAQRDAWLFSVHDNGIGIESQYQERVFEIFQRVHSRTEYQGTGVGLAICKKIVEAHNGCIWIESEAGQGTTVHFTLPKTTTL